MHEPKRVKIIYEDDTIVVVDKLSGVLITPDFKNKTPTLTDNLNKELVLKGEQVRAYPCHRLDRETSGIVVFAKGRKNQELVMQEFKLRKVKKRYIALIQGRLENKKGTIKSYISSSFNLGNRFFKKKPKLAVTSYNLIKSGKDFSLVEVWLLTGRTNQIRIHFKQLGHPLLGERQYAFGKDFALKFRRLALHASNIEFIHPVSHKRLAVASYLPDDMQDFINSRLGHLDLYKTN